MDCSLPGSSFLLTSSKVIQMLKISHRSPRCLFHRNCQKPYAAVSDGYNLLLSDGGCSEKNSNSRLEEDQFLVFVWSLSLFKEKLKHLKVNAVSNSIRIKEFKCCQGIFAAAAAAVKSLQSCPTLCDPIDSPPGSPIPGILQARTLEWVAISFSNAWKWKVKGKSLSRVRLLATLWTAAYQAPPCMGFSRQKYWSGLPLPSPKGIFRQWEI